MPNVRYTISLPSKDSELIRFVEEKRKHVSLSAYIRELIRKDMENQDGNDLEQIYQYVEKRLQANGIVLKETENGQVKGIVDEFDKEVIFDLF